MGIRAKSAEFASYVTMGIHTYRGRLLVQASFVIAAIGMGLASVYFTQLITRLQLIYTSIFGAHPYLMSFATPLMFLAAAGVCKVFAPHAAGSGVPQVLYAASLSNEENTHIVREKILSLRTGVVKVVSTALGFLGGASIGAEGPTVQISGSIFASIGNFVRKYYPQIDFHSYLVAAGGVGIASAFNTPLGGVVFAIEEVAVRGFGKLKHLVMVAVIVAGLTSQALIGDELYLGNPLLGGKRGAFLLWAAVIGVLGGVAGGLFGKLVASERLHRLPLRWWQRALLCGVIVSALGLYYGGQTGGSGYAGIRAFVNGQAAPLPYFFPLAKLLATAFSTLSGMGGGILAPSLSIGGWLGITAGRLASVPELNACALLGMVAYFSGAFQFPMTAVIIVIEMTNEHEIVLPMMVAAVCAYVVARLLMPESLYHILIQRNFAREAAHLGSGSNLNSDR